MSEYIVQITVRVKATREADAEGLARQLIGDGTGEVSIEPHPGCFLKDWDRLNAGADAAYQANAALPTDVAAWDAAVAAWNDARAEATGVYECLEDGNPAAAAVCYGRFLHHIDVLEGRS